MKPKHSFLLIFPYNWKCWCIYFILKIYSKVSAQLGNEFLFCVPTFLWNICACAKNILFKEKMLLFFAKYYVCTYIVHTYSFSWFFNTLCWNNVKCRKTLSHKDFVKNYLLSFFRCWIFAITTNETQGFGSFLAEVLHAQTCYGIICFHWYNIVMDTDYGIDFSSPRTDFIAC